MAGDRLDAIFAALSDPTRRAILAHLSKGEATVTELAHPFDVSLPAITRHLKVLERAGLISRSRQAQWRPCKLEPASLRIVDEWIASYRRFWDERLARAERQLGILQGRKRGVR